jgi:hypothetical protein
MVVVGRGWRGWPWLSTTTCRETGFVVSDVEGTLAEVSSDTHCVQLDVSKGLAVAVPTNQVIKGCSVHA